MVFCQSSQAILSIDELCHHYKQVVHPSYGECQFDHRKTLNTTDVQNLCSWCLSVSSNDSQLYLLLWDFCTTHRNAFTEFTSNLTRLLIAAYIKKPIMHKPSIAQPDWAFALQAAPNITHPHSSSHRVFSLYSFYNYSFLWGLYYIDWAFPRHDGLWWDSRLEWLRIQLKKKLTKGY